MNLTERISAFNQLGLVFKAIKDKNSAYPGLQIGLTVKEYEAFNDLILKVKRSNEWFTEENIRKSIGQWGDVLETDQLTNWTSDKNFSKNKAVCIVMAGNIPLVGFHDFLSVLISGNKALVKLSSDDKFLLPAVIELLLLIEPRFKEFIEIKPFIVKEMDAVIATGSNNSSRYFKQYFSNKPHIIRKNRTSIAILNGEEGEEDLNGLSNDVFSYFGLGCRNISKVFLPKGYDLNKLFKAFFHHQEIVDNNKYGNNYDYNKAVYLMNQDEILENGFMLLKEDKGLFSPISVLFYQYYDDVKEIAEFIDEYENDIQCVVGKNYIPFGSAQKPSLTDYADNIDVLNFLSEI